MQEKIFLPPKRICLGKGVYEFSEVPFEATCFVFVKKAHLHTSVDQRNRARQQFLGANLIGLATELLHRRACRRHPVTVAQTTNGVLANSFLGTWVISHINILISSALKLGLQR
jgi:hypothetical protein